jgi:hypothetical protein
MKRLLIAASLLLALTAGVHAQDRRNPVPDGNVPRPQPGAPSPNYDGNGREQVAFINVTNRVAAGPQIPGRIIITSQEGYARFFKTQALAPCDFTKDFMAIIHLGMVGSQGYAVRVTSVERVYGATSGTTTAPNVLTINYQITKGADAPLQNGSGSAAIPLNGGGTPVVDGVTTPGTTGDRLPGDGESAAPCAIIKIAIPARPEQTRFFEQGGEARVGFNAIARTLSGQGFQNHLVEFDGTVRTPSANAEEKRQTRFTMAELERLSLAIKNAGLPSLPKTIPTETMDGQRFRYSLFDQQKRRTIVEGTRLFEGVHAPKLRPLDEAFEVALSRIERRAVRIEGAVLPVERADTIRIQGGLGLVYELHGPLARILTNFPGRKVLVNAVVQLRTAELAEGAIQTITYPQRAPRSGTIGAGLTMQLLDRTGAAPGPAVKLAGERAQDLCGPEVGNCVLIDAYWFFDEKTRLPSEAYVEAIRGITIAPVELRSAETQPSDFVSELDLRTSIWVTKRKGGAQGVAFVAGQKSGWAPSQFIRYTYTPPTTKGLQTLIDEEAARAEARWKIWKEDYDRRRAASATPGQ